MIIKSTDHLLTPIQSKKQQRPKIKNEINLIERVEC